MLTDRRMFSWIGVVLSSLCCLRAALAGVDVGDVAPKLAIKEWVHGGPVDLGKDAAKKFHLVEFWATWCPPCKASIPLLTEYQKKFQSDLVVVGVTDPDPDRNSITEIRQFVKGQGKNMDYAVALDDGGKTTSAYMDTSQPVGIPQAYLVGKDGRVVWQGSPLDPELETVLKETIAGKYDVKAAKAAADRQRDLEKRFQAMDTAFQMGKLGAVWDGMQEILKLDPANEMAIHLAVAMYVNEEGYGDKLPALAKAHIAEHGRDMKAMFALAGALMEIEDLGRRQPEL
ncbi:MAG: redoxin domain-containing protein, partial [Planctomycetota bacterium]